MRVELLVNLKVASGKVISAGTIFTDENSPIPDFILRRLRRGMAKVLPEKAIPPSSISKPAETIKKSLPVKENKAPLVQEVEEKKVPVPIKKVLEKKKGIAKK